MLYRSGISSTNRLKQIASRPMINGFFFMVASFVIALALFVSPVDAAPAYKYYNSGAEIGATGGKFGNIGIVELARTSADLNTYEGTVVVTFTINNDPWFWRWTGFGNKTATCEAGVQIKVDPNNKNTGSISTPSSLNNPEQTLVDPEADYTGPCDSEIAASISELNQSNISISGSVSDTTPIENPVESDNTRQISVTVYSNKPVSELPSGIQATLTSQGHSLGSEALKFDTEYGNIYFTKTDPGIYTICITPSSIFIFNQCQTVTKVSGTMLVVKFGSAETAYNEFGKVVRAVAEIEVPSGTVQQTFGPITIQLKDSSSGKVIKESKTDTSTADGKSINVNTTIDLIAVFDSIEPGSYKVCIAGHPDLCSQVFIKKINEESHTPETLIKVPADKAGLFSTAGSTTTTCAIDGIGWIVCPVVRFMAWVADGAFKYLANNFLKTDPGIFTDTTGDGVPLFKAWSAMRNIANVAFVIAFLVIIYSQLTSAGISNYGIKKLLPRLIIAAILVNLSYYICQIAVDISNILGWTLKEFLAGIFKGTGVPDTLATSWGATGGGAGEGLFGKIAIGVVAIAAGGAILYASLAALVPVLLAAIVALVMIVFILIARQALIVLLIVLSPLAFVAYLLPNTASWFTKWQKAFVAMLMLFPIISMVYGMSTLASAILTAVSFENIPGDNWGVQIAAAAVAVLPLFVIPGLLKKALDGVGNIGGKISGLGDRWGKSAGDKYTNSPYAKYQKSKSDMDTALTRAGAYTGKNPFKQMSSGIHGGLNRNAILNKLGRGYGNAQSAAGIELAETESEREIKSAAAELKYARLSQDQNRILSNGGSVTDSSGKILDASKNANLKYAAMQSVVATNDVKGINDLWNESLSWGKGPEANKRRAVFGDALQASSGRPGWFGQGAIAAMRQGANKDYRATVVEAIEKNVYSAAKQAAADNDELNIIADVAHDVNSGLSPSGLSQLIANADKALTDPILSKTIGKNIENVTNIKLNIEPPPLK